MASQEMRKVFSVLQTCSELIYCDCSYACKLMSIFFLFADSSGVIAAASVGTVVGIFIVITIIIVVIVLGCRRRKGKHRSKKNTVV